MSIAFTMQKFQDWFTQQWVILRGQKFNPLETPWLIGPYGEIGGIGEDFIAQLSENENLIIKRDVEEKGLLHSMDMLHLPKTDLEKLSKKVIDFYEHTADFQLHFQAKWNPFFKLWGLIINRLFSQRINQLNIPAKNNEDGNLTSEIIELISRNNNKIKYTIWLRKFKSTGKIIYSGIYETCELPSGTTCIKAAFPLPKGNATVLMKPSVGENGELILDSSGKKFGDAGFYFLVKDSKDNHWAQFIRSFTDKLIVFEKNDSLCAKQTLRLWNFKVVNFNYLIQSHS